jgi:hypothetical protein
MHGDANEKKSFKVEVTIHGLVRGTIVAQLYLTANFSGFSTKTIMLLGLCSKTYT